MYIRFIRDKSGAIIDKHTNELIYESVALCGLLNKQFKRIEALEQKLQFLVADDLINDLSVEKEVVGLLKQAV